MASAESNEQDDTTRIARSLQQWQQTLEVDENLVTFSKSRRVQQLRHAENVDVSSILTKLNKCYDKLTSLYMDAEWPCSYAYYHKDDSVPKAAEHFAVIHLEQRKPMFEADIQSRWLSLNEKSKDKLYVILTSAVAIWERIHYDYSFKEWVARPCPPKEDDAHSSLFAYGYETDKEDTVLDVLAGKRSNEDINEAIESLQDGFLGYQKLEDVWQLALTSGLGNEHGHVAVYMLLDVVAGLLLGFDETLPKVAIMREKPSSSSDDLSDSSCSSETSSSISPPRTKRPKLIEESDSDDSGPEQEPSKKRVTWPSHNSYFVDLRVVSLECSSDAARHLIVVEIQSQGGKLIRAQQRLVKELIHVVQYQNEVFGLLFCKTCVFLYKALKNPTGTVTISHRTYYLREGPENDRDTFRVAKFQRLVMDILSCLLHGLKCIESLAD